MRIKEPPSRYGDFFDALNLFFRRKWVRILFWVGVAGAMVLMFVGGFFLRGKISDSKSERLNNMIQTVADHPGEVLSNYWQGRKASAPQIRLDIKHTHLQKLNYTNLKAIENDGRLVTTNADELFVPASVTFGDNTMKGKLRNKGNWKDARSMEKLSLRVKLKGENTLMGMKKFSLHDPKVKDFISEWIFQELLRKEGFVAVRYGFVEVVINGKSRGIHAIEEHFDKRLIEHNQQREGVIVRFDEYQSYYRHLVPNSVLRSGDKSWMEDVFAVSPVDAFGWSQIKEDPNLFAQFKKAHNLLEGFRQGDLGVAEAFDTKQVARLFALSDLLGIHHNLELRNIKFYYNPITSRLQPIGYDQHNESELLKKLIGEHMETGVSGKGKPQVWYDTFFRDKGFYESYLNALEEISTSDYLNEFWDHIDSDYREKMAIIHADEPLYRDGSRNFMKENQGYIRRILHPKRCLEAFKNSPNDKGITLDIANMHTLPIEVAGLLYKGKSIATLSNQKLLQSQRKQAPMVPVEVAFSWKEEINADTLLWDSLEVTSHLLGKEELFRESVHEWEWYDREVVNNDLMRQPANFWKFNFWTIDTEEKTITCKPGKWKLSSNVIISSGYKVLASEGFELNMINGAIFISRSPLHFQGTFDNPIQIYSSDTTGQGILVLEAGSRSRMEHVNFAHLTHPHQDGWSMSGAVNFYESPVDFKYCRFFDNREGDDFLNTIRTDFTMTSCTFLKTNSDAFDGDFCKGKITECNFIHCGNDAIDISGSDLEIENIKLMYIGDKGLSAGENSVIRGREISILHAELGVTSKDFSTVNLERIHIDSSRVGYTAFQKKPEYGPASITVVGATMGVIERPYLIERGSEMYEEEKWIAPSQLNVKEILYGVEYGKSSR